MTYSISLDDYETPCPHWIYSWVHSYWWSGWKWGINVQVQIKLICGRIFKWKRSGAGLLRNPNGYLLEQSLRFGFSASNNEAEYEALISGLGLTRRFGAISLKIFSDSKLVINQVNGSYAMKIKQWSLTFKRWRNFWHHSRMLNWNKCLRRRIGTPMLLPT